MTSYPSKCGDCGTCPDCDARLEEMHRRDNRKILNGKELWERQQQYDRIAAELGGAPDDRASASCFDLHKRIMERMPPVPPYVPKHLRDKIDT